MLNDSVGQTRVSLIQTKTKDPNAFEFIKRSFKAFYGVMLELPQLNLNVRKVKRLIRNLQYRKFVSLLFTFVCWYRVCTNYRGNEA